MFPADATSASSTTPTAVVLSVLALAEANSLLVAVKLLLFLLKLAHALTK